MFTRFILSLVFTTWLSNCFAQVDFRKETIYFLLPTRFFDGDSTNNRPNEWCSYIQGINNPNITDPKDVTWRGDFRGLIQKLNYIKDLGFTAIWITPVVQNRGPLDYHGYHAWDFTRVDPRLESPGATFKDLVEACHAKGMKVVLDIVTNHSGRFGIKGQAELKYNTDPNQTWGKKSDGTVLTDNPNWAYDGLTPNPDDGKIWSRANLAKLPAPYNQNLANYNWPSTESFVNTSDPNWFHQSGNGFVQGWDDTTNCYQRAIAGDCPDLNTGSPAVRDYFFNAYKKFIDDGVDAFRWDTWKHMNKKDIFALADRFKAYKPDLFIFGEVAQKRHELHPVQELNPHWYTWRGNVGSSANAGVSVIDFFAEATFHNIFQDGGGCSGVTAADRYDYLYADPSTLVTWLDNHDFGPNNDWNQRYSGSDQNLAACMNFMFTWRGIPTVYYGTESRFMSGAYTDLHDAAGISRSLNETGRAYFGNAMANAPNHVIYKHIRKLNAIRKAIPALQNGNWIWAGNGPGNGVGFTRQSGNSFVCVGLAKDGSAGFNFSGIPNGTYRDAVTGREINVSNGNLGFTVGSASAGIYVKDGPGMIGESGAGFFEPCVTGCVSPLQVSISPIGNNYSGPVTVTMAATGGSGNYTIFYTMDGTMPTTASTVYSGPFNVSATTIVRAIARDGAGRISELQGERYTFAVSQPIVNMSPSSGNYTSNQLVTMTVTGGKPPYTIYYTNNGNTPNTSSTIYSGPFTVSSATTIKAIAKDANNTLSTVVQRDYTFVIPPPSVTANPASGNFPSGTVSVSLSATSARPPVSIFYTTDDSTPSTLSPLYSGAITINGPSAKTLKFIGRDAIGQISSVQSSSYTFTPIPDFIVYFKRPATWGTNIKIHYWNSLPAGALTPTTWPGIAMAAICGDWYAFTFSGITSTNIIFNDGAGRQSLDLTATQTSWFDNGWLASAPIIGSTPTANFSSSVTSGTSPLTVSFNGNSSTACSALGYAWNFGNGQTATGVSASTTYSTAGTYTVTLTVTDAQNQTATKTQTITVSAPQPAITVYFKKPALWGSNVRVYYWSATPTGALANATWPGAAMTAVCNGWFSFSFPAGVTGTNLIFNDGTNQSPDLSTTTTRYYDGAWLSTTPTINTGPVANFSVSPGSGVSPLTVSVNAGTSTGCSALSYAWNFGNGQIANGVSASTTYSAAGTYTVSLTVTDAQNQTATKTQSITVSAPQPAITVFFKKPATWGTNVRVYYWSASPTGTLANATWPGAAMTTVCNGWYSFSFPAGVTGTNLIFYDGTNQTPDLSTTTTRYYDGAWLGTTPVINSPKANFTLSATSGSIPLTVSANAAGSTTCSGGLSYKWSFGNGYSATTSTASTTYSSTGIYTVKLVVIDGNGLKDSTTQTLTATSTPQIRLHFKRPSTWTNVPRVYYWNTNPAIGSVSWPGLAMTAEVSGWYGYTINGAQTASVIFNNNGSPQTIDLTGVTGEVWYDNGWVSKPAGFAREAQVMENETQPIAFQIYPNPVSQTLHIGTPAEYDGKIQIRMFNAAGQEVENQKVECQEKLLKINRSSAFRSGIYLLQILDAEKGNTLLQTKILFE